MVAKSRQRMSTSKTSESHTKSFGFTYLNCHETSSDHGIPWSSNGTRACHNVSSFVKDRRNVIEGMPHQAAHYSMANLQFSPNSNLVFSGLAPIERNASLEGAEHPLAGTKPLSQKLWRWHPRKSKRNASNGPNYRQNDK
jgi:hypothetical protein